MKRIFLSVILIIAVVSSAVAQNKKAERDSIAALNYRKAVAAIEAKDFVIIVGTYETSAGTYETNTDDANFLSYEKEFVFLQGLIIAGNGYTNQLTVSDYEQSTDKKGNVRISMHILGRLINAELDITLTKGGNFANVIITPTSGNIKRFTGELVPRGESKYFKRANIM